VTKGRDPTEPRLPRRLDARGLLCPLPVLRIAQQVRSMATGERLEVHADDPLFRLDVRAWCLDTGHRLVLLEEEGEGTATRCVIVVAGDPRGPDGPEPSA
jgi:tRNA 2-thiouridine synthesizing protein A